MNDVIALSGVELLALGREARQRYGYTRIQVRSATLSNLSG